MLPAWRHLPQTEKSGWKVSKQGFKILHEFWYPRNVNIQCAFCFEFPYLLKRERERKKRISSTLDSQQKGKCKYQLLEWEESKKSILFKNDIFPCYDTCQILISILLEITLDRSFIEQEFEKTLTLPFENWSRKVKDGGGSNQAVSIFVSRYRFASASLVDRYGKKWKEILPRFRLLSKIRKFM